MQGNLRKVARLQAYGVAACCLLLLMYVWYNERAAADATAVAIVPTSSSGTSAEVEDDEEGFAKLQWQLGTTLLRKWVTDHWLFGNSLLNAFTYAATFLERVRDPNNLFIALLVGAWATIVSFNNLFTIYFNTYCTKLFGRVGRGKVVANMLILFSISSAFGTWGLGRCLDANNSKSAGSSSPAIELGLLFVLLGGSATRVALSTLMP